MDSTTQDTLLIELLSWLLEMARLHPNLTSVISGVGLITSIVGVASLILEPLAILARNTETDADDRAVSWLGRVIKRAIKILAVVARDTEIK